MSRAAIGYGLSAIGLLVACGDNVAPTGSFEIVGHADLGARGMNSALAIAGDTAYVGSRNDAHGVAIVDISDPSHPAQVGEIGAPDEGLVAMSSRELRAVPDLNLLVVLNLVCSPDQHGCSPAAPAEVENLKLYDITDRRAPKLASTYPIRGATRVQMRDPHEFFLWRDPKQADHVLVFVTTPPSAPSLEVVDVSNPAQPTLVVQWDPVRDGGLDGAGPDNISHSIAISDNGKTGYLSHQTGGLAIIDVSALPAIAMITPPDQVLDWAPPGMGPHSAVPALGRPLLVVTEEIYPKPYSIGCPWGHLRTVDITDPTHPAVVGAFAVPENDPAMCASLPANTAFTAHNPTVLHDLALVTWYAAGLQAIDISEPANPRGLAELRPDPLPAVEHEDPALGGSPVEMWSYPVLDAGLIYVVDVRNGLYVLRYHGLWAEQITERAFREGNSNLR
jgi:hypothetical protein